MNALTKTETGTAVALNDEPNYFLEAGREGGGRTIIGTLLKFKKGDYFAGQDNEDVPVGTRFIVNMDYYTRGWIRWWDSKASKQLLGRVAEGHKPEDRSELGDHQESEWERDDRGDAKDPWQMVHYIFLKDPKAEGEESIYTFSVSSKSAINSMKKFLESYGSKMRQHPGEFPVVELRVGHWDSDSYGRIKFPDLRIVGWAPKSAFDGLMEEASDEQDEIPFDVEPARAIAGPGARTNTRF